MCTCRHIIFIVYIHVYCIIILYSGCDCTSLPAGTVSHGGNDGPRLRHDW